MIGELAKWGGFPAGWEAYLARARDLMLRTLEPNKAQKCQNVACEMLDFIIQKDQLYSFACGYLLIPEPFIEKIVFFPTE